jgi:hypothetical protein
MEGTTQGKRKISYTPGAPVDAKKKRKGWEEASTKRRPPARCVNMPALHEILCDTVADTLSRNRLPYQVAMLSMVNRQFRDRITGNFELWYRLYTQWMGPIRLTTTGPVKTARGSLLLYPTIPRALPHFRDIYQPHR